MFELPIANGRTMRLRKTVSPRQLEANRRNSLESTGPKTIRGKDLASRNAFRHGLLSTEIVIETGDGKESREEFDALLNGLQDEYSPEGTMENLLVERIACCFWRLRR